MASKHLKNIKLKQFVLVLALDDTVAYPPCGMRVRVYESWEELVEDVKSFFEECTDVEVPELSDEDSVTTFLSSLSMFDSNPILGWAIYSEDGYIH